MPTILNKRTMVLAVLFLFAFCVRFMFINKGPFHYDTLDLALSSQATLETLTLHYEHGTGYPLTVVTGAGFIFFLRFFGVTDPVFCVNFMSVAMGALGVLLFFFVAEKLFDTPRAMFAGILLAIFPPHVMISTFGKSLTLSICFCLASANAMLRYCRQGKRADLLLAAFFLGCCAAARLSDGLFALPLTVLYFSCGRVSYERFKAYFAFGLFAFLTMVIYYVPMLLERGLESFRHVLVTPDESRFLRLTFAPLRDSFFWLHGFFGTAGILAAVAGFLSMIRNGEARPRYFLYSWFLVLHLFYAKFSSMGPRYLVLAWLPLVIAQGYFLGGFKRRAFVAASAFVLILALHDFIYFAPTLEYRHRHATQVDFARWVAQKTPPHAVIIAMDERIFLKTYAGRQTMSRPNTCRQDLVEAYFKEELDPLLRQGRMVYIISTGLIPYDPCGLFQKTLVERYRLVYQGMAINEDWHSAFYNLDFIRERLYKIELKT